MTYTNEIIDRYDNIASIPTTLTGFFGGASYFSTLDPGQIIFGKN